MTFWVLIDNFIIEYKDKSKNWFFNSLVTSPVKIKIVSNN